MPSEYNTPKHTQNENTENKRICKPDTEILIRVLKWIDVDFSMGSRGGWVDYFVHQVSIDVADDILNE